MTISRFNPPLDYLQAASRASLQSFELARLNHAANLRQEIAALIDQWVQETSEAMLARWMLDHHKSLRPAAMNPADLVRTFLDPATSSLEESLPPISDVLPAPPQLGEPRAPMRTTMARRPQKQRSAAG
jgi:hypothetical protein